MPRNRFEQLRTCIEFTGAGSSAETMDPRWNLVKGFVDTINDHRATKVKLSHLIYVDESMSRWYGLGGSWISIGTIHYVSLDRKPESGCEIKLACCGVCGIVIRLELTFSANDNVHQRYEGNYNHGTSVLLRLVEPRFHKDRAICAESYFASVETAQVLLDNGLKFTGVVKTARKDYPVDYLSGLEMADKGSHVTMVTSKPGFMAVTCVERDRCHFISSTGATSASDNIHRARWRSRDGSPHLDSIEISIPNVCEKYYGTCSQIDKHNRCRQDDLGLEKKFEVKDWAMRVNTSLLAICIVESWKLYSGCRKSRLLTPNYFYCQLADGLIDNGVNGGLHARRRSAAEISDGNMDFDSGFGVHLTPTKRRCLLSDGTSSNAAYQSRCSFCKNTRKSKFLCSGCFRNIRCEVYICHLETGRDRFKQHVQEVHRLEYEENEE